VVFTLFPALVASMFTCTVQEPPGVAGAIQERIDEPKPRVAYAGACYFRTTPGPSANESATVPLQESCRHMLYGIRYFQLGVGISEIDPPHFLACSIGYPIRISDFFGGIPTIRM
jgi:hypothetical protein